MHNKLNPIKQGTTIGHLYTDNGVQTKHKSKKNKKYLLDFSLCLYSTSFFGSVVSTDILVLSCNSTYFS
jgi:hypothetical protein